jgi:hypothetical protein
MPCQLPLKKARTIKNPSSNFITLKSDVEYPLPVALRTGPVSPVLTVKFAAGPGSTASSVFDVRLLK